MNNPSNKNSHFLIAATIMQNSRQNTNASKIGEIIKDCEKVANNIDNFMQKENGYDKQKIKNICDEIIIRARKCIEKSDRYHFLMLIDYMRETIEDIDKK